MGIYINPPGEKKEDFIGKFGKMLRIQKSFFQDTKTCGEFLRNLLRDENRVVVAHVLNPGFTCAAVLFSTREAFAFSLPQDPRPVAYYSVPTKELTKEVLSGLDIQKELLERCDFR